MAGVDLWVNLTASSCGTNKFHENEENKTLVPSWKVFPWRLDVDINRIIYNPESCSYLLKLILYCTILNYYSHIYDYELVYD